MKQSLKYFAVFLLWNIGISVVLLVSVRSRATTGETLAGIGVALVLAYLVLRVYVLRVGKPDEGQRARDLRMLPLRGKPLRWTLAAAPALLLFSWSLGELYIRLVPVPPESLDPFGDLFGTPLGRLMLAVLAIGIAPLLEELFFRGLIQRTLERRWGAVGGVLGGAGLFALVHFLPWVFPLHFALGAAFGFAVYATRSIWAGVVLHTVNNVAALLAQGLDRDELTVEPTIWQTGLDLEIGYTLAMLAVSGALSVWIAGRLWRAGRENRLHHP